MYVISQEQPAHAAPIETLLDLVFGPGRHAKTSYRFRDGRPPLAGLSLVATAGGRLVGTIRHWRILVGTRPALLLGPLGVAPDRQGIGIGRALIEASLARAAAQGHGACLLVGDVAYYGPKGFQPAAPLGIHMEDERPERLLARAVLPQGLVGLAGRVRAWPLQARPLGPATAALVGQSAADSGVAAAGGPR